MLRLQYRRYGGPDELSLDDIAPKQPETAQIRIRVMAAASNPMDRKIRNGDVKMMTGSQFPRGVGNDFAGVVDAVGPGVTRLHVGDEVFGAATMRNAGAFAETIVTEEALAALKPPSLSFEQAATLPTVGATAWIALIDKGGLRAGQSVFVNGCLGGVGRTAVQIARLRGAVITGSCRAAGRAEAAALGVTTVVDFAALDFAPLRRRFDIVFDTAGTLSLRQCGAMLKRGGVAVHIVLSVAKMIAIQLSPRHRAVFGQPTVPILEALAAAAGAGALVPQIGCVVPLAAAIPAIVALEQQGVPKGKLVIVPSL